MALGIQPERECGLGLASRSGARARRPARSRSRSSDSSSGSRGSGGDFRSRRFLGLVNLGGLVDLLFGFLVLARQAIRDLGVLVMHRRTHRSEAGRMRPRMLDDIVAERVVIVVARGLRRLGRFETHVVPAEVLEALAGNLAESLRAHGRTGGALAGEKTGREGGER